MKLLSLGPFGAVARERIIAIVSPDTSPVKRLVQDAKEDRRVIDVSGGKKTLSVILTDSDHVILSRIPPAKLRLALQNDTDVEEETE